MWTTTAVLRIMFTCCKLSVQNEMHQCELHAQVIDDIECSLFQEKENDVLHRTVSRPRAVMVHILTDGLDTQTLHIQTVGLDTRTLYT